MPHNTKRQASFSRLAAGQVASRRSDIMLAATDTFCNLSRPGKTQVDQFRELFYSLIGETDESAKRLISSALSRHFYAPRQILLYLALEDAAIAAPILAYSKSLGQFDLLQVIDKTSNLHHRVIANRDDLGKTVISKLIEIDDYLVVRRLENNPAIDAAYFTSTKPSIEDVMEQPAITEVTRTQGIARALDEMNAILKSDKTANSEPSVKMEPLTAETNDIPLVGASKPSNTKIKVAMDELITLANRGKRLGSVEDLLSNLPVANNTSFPERLLQATIRKSRQDQVAEIQHELGLSLGSAQSVFEDRSGDTLSVCLKAADVDAGIALQIITQSILNVGLSSHNTQRISKLFPALNQQACHETVNSWRDTKVIDTPDYVSTTADSRIEDRRGIESNAPGIRARLGQRGKKLFGT